LRKCYNITERRGEFLFGVAETFVGIHHRENLSYG
jgi:hypothetical protein